MATETDLFGEKLPFLTSTSYLNDSRVKFIEMIQETISQKREK